MEHATASEFESARDYLKLLPQPQMVVPGNHDYPFYDPFRRYWQGLRYYQRYISNDCDPLYRDAEMVVTGISTPRIFPMKGGRVSRAQLSRIRARTCDLPREVVRVLVTHHPLDLPEQFRRRQLVRKAARAVEILSPCIDLMLAGHLHLSSTGATAVRYRRTGHSAVFAQAGTAISRRNKGEPNSFNEIRIESWRIQIRHHVWDEGTRSFRPHEWEVFETGEGGWKKVEGAGERQVQL